MTFLVSLFIKSILEKSFLVFSCMPDADKLHVKVPNAVSNTSHHITSD